MDILKMSTFEKSNVKLNSKTRNLVPNHNGHNRFYNFYFCDDKKNVVEQRQRRAACSIGNHWKPMETQKTSKNEQAFASLPL